MSINWALQALQFRYTLRQELHEGTSFSFGSSLSIRLASKTPPVARLAYSVTVLELQKLGHTFILVYAIVVGGDTFPVDRGLESVSTVLDVVTS